MAEKLNRNEPEPNPAGTGKQPLRVVIAAGGTAGHLVPALAVADALRDRGADVSFIGAAGRAEEELVPAAGYEIDTVEVSGLSRRNVGKAVRSVRQALAAVPAVKKILRRRQAEVVMGGGGYVAWPAGVAAGRLGLPLVITEADRRLGLTNRMLARRAAKVCLAFPLPGHDGPRFVVTGRPVGRAVLDADRGNARRRFGIGADEKCVAVFGGSQGARSINFAAASAFAGAPDNPAGFPVGEERGFRVVHVSGRRDFEELGKLLTEAGDGAAGYELIEYEPDLGDVLAASDLVVGRSGGSVFEIAARALPSALVPYPHAADDHQTTNAEWMAEAGAGVMVADSDINARTLGETVRGLIEDDDRLAAMSAAAAGLAKPDAADDVAGLIIEAAKGGAA